MCKFCGQHIAASRSWDLKIAAQCSNSLFYIDALYGDINLIPTNRPLGGERNSRPSALLGAISLSLPWARQLSPSTVCMQLLLRSFRECCLFRGRLYELTANGNSNSTLLGHPIASRLHRSWVLLWCHSGRRQCVGDQGVASRT